jgi:adenine phosphoribosyltransferase
MASTPVDLRPFIRDVQDFPKPGVLFRDVTPVLQNVEAFRYVIEEMTRPLEADPPGAVVGIESRGFFFAAPVAYKLGVPLVPVRKAGKLPADRMSVEFALEYGEGQLDIHTDALRPGQNVAIIDDLLATGGTAEAAARLIELSHASVKSMSFLVELVFLGGRERLKQFHINSLLTYDSPR